MSGPPLGKQNQTLGWAGAFWGAGTENGQAYPLNDSGQWGNTVHIPHVHFDKCP